jgi:hypothetical protein
MISPEKCKVGAVVRGAVFVFGLGFAGVGCKAPSPPVEAPAAAPLPPGSRPITRDPAGAPPPLTEAERAAHEADAFALLEGHVSLPSEAGAVSDWRAASITVDEIEPSPAGTSAQTIRHRYELAVTELAACYRRLSSTSRKGEAKAIIRLDPSGKPTRVEWRSGTLAPDLYACSAETLLAIPVPKESGAREVRVRLTYLDR